MYAFTSNILSNFDTLVLNNAVGNSQNWIYTIRLFKTMILYILNVMHLKVPPGFVAQEVLLYPDVAVQVVLK